MLQDWKRGFTLGVLQESPLPCGSRRDVSSFQELERAARLASMGRGAQGGIEQMHRDKSRFFPPPPITKSGASQLPARRKPGSWALGIPDCGFTRRSNQLAQQMSEPAWPGLPSTEFKTATLSGAAPVSPPGEGRRRLEMELCSSWLLSELLKYGPRRGDSSPPKMSVSTEINWIFMVRKVD